MTARVEDERGGLVVWWICDACHTQIRSHTPRAQEWHRVSINFFSRHACTPVCLVNVLREWTFEIERKPQDIGVQGKLRV